MGKWAASFQGPYKRIKHVELAHRRLVSQSLYENEVRSCAYLGRKSLRRNRDCLSPLVIFDWVA